MSGTEIKPKRGTRMRGDQLACQWRVIRAIEASSNGLTVAEISKREETGIRTIYRDLEALRAKCHPEAQGAPREIFRLVFPFLDSFLAPSHSIRKTIKRSSTLSPLNSLRLGMRCLNDFIRHSFKVMHDELYTVKVRISLGWDRWVGEKIWNDRQKITRLSMAALRSSFKSRTSMRL